MLFGSLYIILPGKAQNTACKKHLIAQGETLYSLAKLYNIPITDLYKVNPGIATEGIKAGHYLQIPVNNNVKTHIVQKKETLYNIAQLYGCSINDLLKANPGLTDQNKLKKGTILQIPEKRYTPLKKDRIPSENENEFVKKRTGSIRIAVILPFKSNNSTSERAIEFYQGILLAIDSLRNNNSKNIEIYAYDSGQTEAEIQYVLRKVELKNADVIFGPVFAEQIPILSDYTKRNEIPLIIPFSSKCDDVETNSYAYTVNAPDEFQEKLVLKEYVKIFKNDHTLCICTSEGKLSRFTALLRTTLTKQNISNGQSNYISTEEDFLKTFSKEKKNIVVPSSSDINSLNVLIPQLKTFLRKHPEYVIQLFGYPDWQTYTSSQLENFHLFNTYIYSPFYRNPLDWKNKAFDSMFEKNFNKPMIATYPKIAVFGFDCGGYFIKMLQQHGEIDPDKEIIFTPMQSPFSFKKYPLKNGGNINTSIYFINYKTNHTVNKYIIE